MIFRRGSIWRPFCWTRAPAGGGQETLDRFPHAGGGGIPHRQRDPRRPAQSLYLASMSTSPCERGGKPSLLNVPLPLGKIMFEEDHAVLEEVKAFLQSQPLGGGV